MFMTNYELVYGKRKFSSNCSNTSVPTEYHSAPVTQSETSDTVESSKTGFMQNAVGFMKSDDTKQKLGSLAGKLKNAAGVAAGAASGLAKSAVETAKSEETAAKIASLKEKAQSVAGGISTSVSGLGNKASEAIASRKSNSVNNEIDISETDTTHTKEYFEDAVQEESVYTDDYSEIESQDNYVSDEEYEADEYIEEYEEASDETEEEIPVYNEAPKEVYHSQTVYTKTHDNTYSNTYDQANSAPTQEKSNKKPVIVGIAAGLGVCAVFAGGLFGGMYLMKNKNDTPNNDNVIAENTTEASTTEVPTEKVTEEITTEAPTEEKTEAPVDIPEAEIIFRDIYYDEESIYSAYLNIVNGMDFTIPMRGFLADMNDDGINELILPENGQYTIYYYSEENIKSYSFGNYMALDNFVMYKVDGDNGNKYIYYRDNYSYKSLQGYFSLDKENQLNISIDYPYEDTSYFADWKIIYNNSEGFAKGFESVDTFYAQPDDCHSALLASFSHYNLDISDNSNYSKINGLYYDELVDMLKVNEVQSSQPSFSSDINDYPLYFERLQLIAQNAGSDNYDYGSGLSIAYTYYDTQFGYSLQDLNSDGIPELITTAGEMGDGASSVAEIYAISNNQLVMLCQTWDRLWYYMCENNVVASTGMGNGSGGVTYDKYTGGSELETIDSYSWEYIDGAENYYINGNRVSDDEIHQLENKYKSITIDTTPLPNISSSANIVTPCTIYGQIHAPDGGPINGYATSYIVEGGEYSCQRVDLMNNWHVTAVNSFTKNGVTWYELYDTDDGDYYGWLDEDHIKFY